MEGVCLVDSSNNVQMSDIIGVIWTGDISKGGWGGGGYGLIFTHESVIGSKTTPWWSGLVVYLGTGSRATQSDRQKVPTAVERLLEKKEFELSKASITRITFGSPGPFSRGKVMFKSLQGDVTIRLASRSANIHPEVVDRLLASLVTFARDRLYDEKTGALVADELTRRKELPI